MSSTGSTRPYPHETAIDAAYATADRAAALEASLQREVGEIDDDRSRTRLSREGRELSIRVEAADLVALRAAINTWLSLLSVAERTTDVAERSDPR